MKLTYDIAPRVEAFSTMAGCEMDFDVVVPRRQDHGVLVAKLPQEAAATEGVDALITDAPGLRIGVRTADCVPILLYDAKRQAIAAVHSGWKGTLANIAAAAMWRMGKEYGTDAADVKVLIGPCIHQAAFEVGDDLCERFATAGYGAWCKRMPSPRPGGEEKWHIDLPGICREQLSALGVKHIAMREECTYEQHSRFYSSRWLGQELGEKRIYNCIMLKVGGEPQP